MTNTCENPGKMVHILFTATILWKYVIGIDTPVIFQWCEIIEVLCSSVFLQQMHEDKTAPIQLLRNSFLLSIT